VTWDTEENELTYRECCEALTLVKAGDVGLHRDRGFLSNLAIPGCFKHAWIFVTGSNGNDITDCMIVEATSDGVIHRHAMYPMWADFDIILRPKNITKDCIDKAVGKARSIIGHPYDIFFRFNVEEELDKLQTIDIDQDGKAAAKQFETFDMAFSCTEVVAYSYWHVRNALQIFRTGSMGKKVILADSYVNPAWEIIYVSPNLTLEQAAEFGLPEEGLEQLKFYWQKKTPSKLFDTSLLSDKL